MLRTRTQGIFREVHHGTAYAVCVRAGVLALSVPKNEAVGEPQMLIHARYSGSNGGRGPAPFPVVSLLDHAND